MQAQKVTRRLGINMPRFDPFALRRYCELQRIELQRKAVLVGYYISQLPPNPALGIDCGVKRS